MSLFQKLEVPNWNLKHEVTNCDLKEGKSEMKKIVKKKSTKIISKIDDVTGKVFLVRGHKVMVDKDLADLYEVPTKALNQAVKRNIERFPEDFMFRLNKSETGELVTNCDRLKALKHATSSPIVFTEQGVAMLSSVLKSDRAVQVNIAIMRAFVQMREMASTHKSILKKIDDLERIAISHNGKIEVIFEAIKELSVEAKKPRRKIGFKGSSKKK